MNGHSFHGIHTGIGQTNGGIHLCNVITEMHQRKVQTINTHVQQSAAAEIGIQDPGLVGHGVAQIGGQTGDFADHTAGQNLIDDLPGGHIPGPDGFRDEYTMLFCKSAHFCRFLGVHRESLFAENCLSCLDAICDLGKVMGVGCCDVNKFNFRIRQQFFVGAISFCKAVLRCKFLGPAQVPGCNCHTFHILHTLECPCHRAGHPTGAENTDLHKDPLRLF